MPNIWQHPADKALCVIPSLVRPLYKNVGKSTREFSPLMKEFSRGGCVFRKLCRSACYLRDPVAEVLYPGSQKVKHSHKPYGGCQEDEIIPKCPVQVPSCCRKHKDNVKTELKTMRRFLYNSPRPKPPAPKDRLQNKLERIVSRTAAENERLALPLSAILVRWHQPTDRSRGKGYDIKNIQKVMEQYGAIRSISALGPCYAYIVYENLADCCQPVQQRVVEYCLHGDMYQLFCYWYHRSLEGKLFYRSRNKQLATIHDEFIFKEVH